MHHVIALKRPLALLVILQIFDFLTTVVVLSMGGKEGNPLVQYFFAFGPVYGLIVTKIVVIALGILCAFSGKSRGLRVANWAYSAIVAWNIFMMARLSVSVNA